MTIAHLPIRRVLIAAALASAVSACVTLPVNPGYVSFNPARTDKLLISGQGGASLMDPRAIGGSLHMEPFVSPRTSIPVSLMGFGHNWAGGTTGRVGLRYRLSDWASLGGGASGAFATTVSGSTQYHAVGMHLDVEASIGKEWDWVGISLTPRATLVLGGPITVGYLPAELAVAFFLGRSIAVTVHAVPCLLIGGTLGFNFATGVGVLVKG